MPTANWEIQRCLQHELTLTLCDGSFNCVSANNLPSLLVRICWNSYRAERVKIQSLLDLVRCQMVFLWWRWGGVLSACNVGTNPFEIQPVGEVVIRWVGGLELNAGESGQYPDIKCCLVFALVSFCFSPSVLFCLSALLCRHPEPWYMCRITSHWFVPRCWHEAVGTLLSRQMGAWENVLFWSICLLFHTQT